MADVLEIFRRVRRSVGWLSDRAPSWRQQGRTAPPAGGHSSPRRHEDLGAPEGGHGRSVGALPELLQRHMQPGCRHEDYQPRDLPHLYPGSPGGHAKVVCESEAALKVHKIENFLAPNSNYVPFHC